jgi:hypothetical protein
MKADAGVGEAAVAGTNLGPVLEAIAFAQSAGRESLTRLDNAVWTLPVLNAAQK